MATLALVLNAAPAPGSSSLLPLAVGDHWRYECGYIRGEIPVHAYQHLCVRRSADEQITVVLAVADSTTVPLAASGLFAQLPAADSPQDGVVYYTLAGSVVPLFFSRGQFECVFGPNTSVDQMLVRVGPEEPFSSRAGMRKPDSAVVEQGVWIRGIHAPEGWWLFDAEYLFWDLSPLPGMDSCMFRAEDCLHWDLDRSMGPAELLARFPRRTSLPVDLAFLYVAPNPVPTLAFSRGVGIVQISEFVLATAVVGGTTVTPTTSVMPHPWSQVKARVP